MNIVSLAFESAPHPRKEKFVESAQRFTARHGGHCRLSEVQNDYTNLDT